MFRPLILCSLIGFISAIGIGRTQSAAAKGVLMCNGKPASGVLVKLYDNDSGLDSDDLLGKTKTDSQGHFSVSGHASEFLTIDPKINIYHDCEDKILGIEKPCQRKVRIDLPSKYVSSGATPKEVYDAGTIQLAGKFKGEGRDCAH